MNILDEIKQLKKRMKYYANIVNYLTNLYDILWKNNSLDAWYETRLFFDSEFYDICLRDCIREYMLILFEL